MANPNYSSIYSIKDFAIKELAPKYFDMSKVNELNVGLLGYTTEMIGNTTEDAFNTITMLMNEIFPNLAILPESIYSYAALFQIGNIFAVPSALDMMLFISEADVLNNASRVNRMASTSNEDLFEFYIDSDTIIDVEGIQFMLDYDIKINYKPYRHDYIFTAMYHTERYGTSFNNSISSITNPYIKVKRMVINKQKYLMLMVKTHRVNRFTMSETIVTNDIINLPTFTVDFDESLANFEVFYKEPSSKTFVQLEKRMHGTPPLKVPFCYYKLKNDNQLEISFSARDNYFQPKFNAELNIDYMISTGTAGNFPLYTGNDIVVQPSSTIHEYNNNIVMFAIPQSASVNGADSMTLEQLKQDVIEKFSTVASYTNENDLQMYFSNFNSRFNSDILFIKKRDDVFQRLFTAFTIFKTSANDVFHTNTLNLSITPDKFDHENEQSDSYIFKPGHLFTYKDGYIDTTTVRDGTIFDADTLPDQFVYTNPFLIYFVKNPAVVGYYLNTVNSKHIVDYVDVNNESLIQFICNSLTVKRNAVVGEDEYVIKIIVSPTTELDNPIVEEKVDELTGEKVPVFSNSLIIRMCVEEHDIETLFCDFTLTDWDLKNQLYTYEYRLKTDDYMTLSNKMRVLNMFDSDSVPEDYDKSPKLIPMYDCKMNIHTWYAYKGVQTSLNPSDLEAPLSLHGYTKTNTYSTDTNRMTFIYPVQMVRSRAKYIHNGDGVILPDGRVDGGTYDIMIESCPFTSAKTLVDPVLSNEFFDYLYAQYRYISDILSLITNNYAVDIKFYNTYGRSKNFRIGDDSEPLLDRVNIKLHIKIKPIFGTDESELIRDLRIYIKSYIETINDGGTNSFYVSNLIQSIENDFPAVKYMKFVSINDLPSSIQVIENTTVNLDMLTKEERMGYTPEYLTIRTDDILIDII